MSLWDTNSGAFFFPFELANGWRKTVANSPTIHGRRRSLAHPPSAHHRPLLLLCQDGAPNLGELIISRTPSHERWSSDAGASPGAAPRQPPSRSTGLSAWRAVTADGSPGGFAAPPDWTRSGAGHPCWANQRRLSRSALRTAVALLAGSVSHGGLRFDRTQSHHFGHGALWNRSHV